MQADGDHALAVVLEPKVRDNAMDPRQPGRLPEEVEDVDGFQDADGCPDATVSTTIRVVDGVGRAVGASRRVMGRAATARAA